MSTDEITQKVDSAQVQEASRHLAIGALVEKFYRELTSMKKAAVDSFLPQDLVDLLNRR